MPTGAEKVKPNKNQKPVSLIEFGPGRGTLMKDIIRVLLNFGHLVNIEINFVEASPFLKKEQQDRLKEELKKHEIWYSIFLLFLIVIEVVAARDGF